MAARQGAAEYVPVGEVGGKLLTNRQGLGLGRLRFLQACGVEEEQVAQVAVQPGQGLPELGPGGEVGG